jgi:hypothetical protein
MASGGRVNALDAVIEIFTWVGLGTAAILGVAALIVWALDGSWLPADALVDHEDGVTFVRWFDGDGDANNARVSGAEQQALAGLDRTPIWYRHGWRDTMRLTRRTPVLRAVITGALAMLAVGIVALVASWVLLFVG